MSRIVAPAARVSRALLEDELGVTRPDGPPRAHAPGVDSSRILVVGNGVAIGAGVRSHDLSLPGSLARAVAARTGFGVDVDLIAESRLSLDRIVAAVRAGNPLRYDAVVVVTGSNEALGMMPPSRWRRRLTAALTQVRGLMAPETVVVVAGVPADFSFHDLPGALARVADAHAAALDRVSAEVCAELGDVRFIPLLTRDGVASGAAEDFARWSESLADQIAPRIRAPGCTKRADEVSESRRQAAVDGLRLDTDSDDDPRLRRIVETARRVFGTETALFTVLDRDVQRHLARSGSTVTQIPRGDSFCQYTILDAEGMIVEDALLDERFRDNPLVVGEPHVRFYAGFPVDSPDGERIGAVCVFDPAPRRTEEVDMSLLRELSHLVQTELWRYFALAAIPNRGPRSLARTLIVPSVGPIRRVISVESDRA